MAMNQALVGKRYAPVKYGVTAEATRRYAAACNETSDRFLDEDREGGIVAPPVQRHRFNLFVRSSAASPPRSAPRCDVAEAEAAPVATVAQTLDADQTFRYAQVSGDRTKIHLDGEIAKKAGLPGIIAHGLCTMAFASRAAIDALCEGDPARLARLSVRFARPVFPGQTLTTRIWSAKAVDGRQSFRLETRNPDGVPVLSAGVCEVRP
jgi:acyl dehydratase